MAIDQGGVAEVDITVALAGETIELALCK